jgi:signal transduction histidine kinase
VKLLGFDSLDALRTSLTARLGEGRPIGDSSSDLAPVIGRLLLDEARENERRIAAVRVTLSLVYLGLALVAVTNTGGLFSFLASIAGAWCVASALLYLALRRGWYRVWIRRAAPGLDAIAIVGGSLLSLSNSGVTSETHAALTANAALLCGFLVFTGALRLTRPSTYLSSALAVLAFLAVAINVRLPAMPAIGIVAVLLASSALSGRVTDAIRRVIATEVRRLSLERQIERADARVARAQAASVAREEVLRIVAHDLRNPLSTILMASDLLGEPAMGDDLRAKQAAIVKRTGARMNRLIQDLLNVARMDTGNLTIHARPIAPAQLVANAMELMQPLATEKSLLLVESVTEGLPSVNADAERIGQVFSNLIGNAIKFTPAGGRITLAVDAADGRVWFSVTDTGPGIPPEQLERVFGPFWQARRTDQRGIGLGLTIARGIVEAHGGTIGVDSEVGVGTKFWFALATK